MGEDADSGRVDGGVGGDGGVNIYIYGEGLDERQTGRGRQEGRMRGRRDDGKRGKNGKKGRGA